ncbi:hypothetical protein [Ascidiimonas sp. W6]|uniref:hypothetical protein n=1 Tax=Ascidiimonas meishanensis TaxID=3128903 RepID=UPI0030EEF2FD
MKTQTDKTQESQSSIPPTVTSEPSKGGTAQLVDNRSSTVYQRKLQQTMNDQCVDNTLPIQRKSSKGSSRFQQIAANMGEKYGVNTSKLVATHNSSFPAKLEAAATIQGNNIHFAPGMDTDHTIRHEVAHSIDNTLNGTPKGNQTVNGRRIDTTREKTVDRMASDTNTSTQLTSNKKVFGRQGSGSNMNTPYQKAESEKVSESNQLIQRAPLFGLRKLIPKLRNGGFTFNDNDVNVDGEGNQARLTIRQMQHGNMNFTNMRFGVVGRLLDGDMAQSVNLHIDNITGNNIAAGTKLFRVAVDNLDINAFLVNKIRNLGAFLKNKLFRWILSWLPRRIRPERRAVPQAEYMISMLGADSEVTIQALEIEILRGSISTRTGRGGYTGEADQVQTQSQEESTINVRDLNLHVDEMPRAGRGEFVTTATIGALNFDQNKRKLIKNGRQVNRPKNKRNRFDMQDISLTIHQNADNFNINNITFDNQNQNSITLHDKGPFRLLIINQLQSNVDQNGNGNVQANIAMTLKYVSLNIQFAVNVPVNNWNVTLDDVINQIGLGLRSYYLPVPNMVINQILAYFLRLRDPGALRRTLEVFDPAIPGTNRDVITTAGVGRAERATGIDIARLFEHHAAAKMRRAVQRDN